MRLLAAVLPVARGVLAEAEAASLSRPGGQAVHDTDLNVTWLADANQARGAALLGLVSRRLRAVSR